ncbi:hypothetical protein [Companilactobacillus keshanensis]|uniref:Uncharacterized protein n=1 Tax=Companilactobacillus keshanensis TaxID=2486003 RepID=A0ABW4BTA9_9LACO|nr:hypothetical protein [Companilactobacillus keshanensis]
MLKIDYNDYTWFLFALTLIFAAAKVFGFITWNWLWVFSPLLFVGGVIVVAYIISYGFILVCMLIYGVVAGIKKVFSHEND